MRALSYVTFEVMAALSVCEKEGRGGSQRVVVIAPRRYFHRARAKFSPISLHSYRYEDIGDGDALSQERSIEIREIRGIHTTFGRLLQT